MRPSDQPNQYDTLAEDPFLDMMREHGIDYSLRVRRSLCEAGVGTDMANSIMCWLQHLYEAEEGDQPVPDDVKRTEMSRSRWRRALEQIEPPTPAQKGGLVSRR